MGRWSNGTVGKLSSHPLPPSLPKEKGKNEYVKPPLFTREGVGGEFEWTVGDFFFLYYMILCFGS
jgi:hypothetical protein